MLRCAVMTETKPGIIGRSVPRREDPPLITGQGRFAADINFPGQWIMRVVRSPVAHGEIKGVDTSAALALPGVPDASITTSRGAMSISTKSAASSAT